MIYFFHREIKTKHKNTEKQAKARFLTGAALNEIRTCRSPIVLNAARLSISFLMSILDNEADQFYFFQ